MSFSLPQQQQQTYFSVPNSASNDTQSLATRQNTLQSYSIPSNASSSSLADMHMNPETHEAGYEEDDEEDFEMLLPRSSRKPFFEQQLELELKIKEDINASTVEDDDDVHVNWEEDDGFEDAKQEETKESLFKQIESENEDNHVASVAPVKEELNSFEKSSVQQSAVSVQAQQEDHFMEAASKSPPHFEDAYSLSKDFHYSTYSESEDHHSTSSQMNDSNTFYNLIETELPKENSNHVSHFETLDVNGLHSQQPLTSALLEAAASVAPSLCISTISSEINKSRKKQKSPTEEVSTNDDIIKGGGVAHKRHIETDEFLDDSDTNLSSCSKLVLIEFKSLRDKAYLKNKFPDILYTLTWKHKYDMRITSSEPIFTRLTQDNLMQSIILDIVMANTLNTALYDKHRVDEKHKYVRKKSQQDILSSSSSALDIPSGTDSIMVSSSSDTSSVGAKSKRRAQDTPQNGETIKIAKIKKESDREVKITLGIHPTYCSKRFAYEPFRMKIEFDEKRALSASQLQQMQASGLSPLHFVKYSTKFQTFAKKLSSDDLNGSAPPTGTSNTEVSEEEHDSSSRSQQQRQGRSRSKSPSVKRQRSPSLSKAPLNVEPPNQILHQTLHQTPSSSVLDTTLSQQHHFVPDVLQQPLQAIPSSFGIGNTAPQLVFPNNNPFFITPNGSQFAFPLFPQPYFLTPTHQSQLSYNYAAPLVFSNQMNQNAEYASKITSMMNGMEMNCNHQDSNLSTPTINSSSTSSSVGYFSPSSFLTGNSTPLPPNTPPPFTPSLLPISPSLVKDIESLQQSPAPQHSFL